MFKPETHLLPLSEHRQLSKLVPEYVQGGLALDTRRLHRLTVLGCLDDAVNFSVYSGESTSYDTQVVGNVGGVALGGAGAVRQPQLSRSVEHYISDHGDDFHPLKPAQIEINSTALQEKVQQYGKARDPRNWARHISAAIGDGVSEAAWNHLVGGANKNEIYSQTGVIGGVMMIDAVFNDFPLTPHELPGYALNLLVWMNIGRGLMSDSTVPLKRRCWSIVPFAHIDRAVMVKGLAKALPVVRPIKETKR